MNNHNRGGEIGGKNLVDAVIIEFLRGTEQAVTRVIYHNVNLSMLPEHLRDKAVDSLYVRHIKNLTVKGIRVLFNQFLHLIGLSHGADHRVAYFQKLLCHLVAKSA